MGKLVIATTTFSQKLDLRLSLALRTITEADKYGYDLVIVDGGSPEGFLREAASRGHASILKQNEGGMGASRRQALREAGNLAGNDGVVVWMEPEKYPFVSQIGYASLPITNKQADLVIPERLNLNSYPEEQQYAEYIGNLSVGYMIGRKLDLWFGPRIMNGKALQEFMCYRGEYGNDTWDSISIPVFRCIAAKLRVVGVKVPYVHPLEQTEEEQGDLNMLIKRIDQLRNLVPAYRKAAEEMGLIITN